jgi:hypothetical protein
MCFFFVFQIFVCVRVCMIINFINPFKQMPVNTRRQTAGLSPLIKVSKNRKKTVPKWQIFHNPPGWSNTHSNIESFNATIKRDFSLRKRYSVWGLLILSKR